MWRRTYLLLVLVRLWFALSPSYLHPDENFQGPEVIAGQIFKYPVRLTWEFTSDNPIRSVFPLWPVYGLPMLLLRWLWIGNGNDGEIPPIAVFWTLRVLMFIISFVLEDWAIHELVPSRRHHHVAILLVASSYVTWTFQTHTFSNSIETLVVLWSLVLIERILETAQSSSLLASTVLGIVAVFGFFNRITFPAFLLIPGLRLIPHFINKSIGAVDIPAPRGSFLASNYTTAALFDTAAEKRQIFERLLMGVYHQGGIVPAQVFLSKQPDATQAVWWKTYMPPIWLLNGKNEVLHTKDVAGMAGDKLLEELAQIATCDTPADRRSREYLKEKTGAYLIAPLSTTWLDPYLENKGLDGLRFREFGMYVMFPIGIMFYFGTNLDERFAVPDFWPKPEQANRVPLERDEIHAELQRLRARRLYLRDRRLEAEASTRA
ncbi:hypothetical protein GQX73_g4444 [Xylaria multiplex]|uniref:Mannosyltransferase n=1 Tax=Xylaria multiplex TaxID=323545 RepID=A0A7C8MTK4_9PEZI|nr:hypothetical protein GQX73_g4444 [Xylaria multiplex]